MIYYIGVGVICFGAGLIVGLWIGYNLAQMPEEKEPYREIQDYVEPQVTRKKNGNAELNAIKRDIERSKRAGDAENVSGA